MRFYERRSDLASLLPDRLGEVYELAVICAAAGQRIDEANLLISKAVDNNFITTADIDGILRWESILGVSSPLDQTMQARRDALISKLITRPPINLAVLKNIIQAYMGLEVELSVDGYTVKASYRGQSRLEDLTPLFVTVNQAIPADMLFEIKYRYLVWQEFDGLELDFDGLDAQNAVWDGFEKGEWIDG